MNKFMATTPLLPISHHVTKGGFNLWEPFLNIEVKTFNEVLAPTLMLSRFI